MEILVPRAGQSLAVAGRANQCKLTEDNWLPKHRRCRHRTEDHVEGLMKMGNIAQSGNRTHISCTLGQYANYFTM